MYQSVIFSMSLDSFFVLVFEWKIKRKSIDGNPSDV